MIFDAIVVRGKNKYVLHLHVGTNKLQRFSAASAYYLSRTDNTSLFTNGKNTRGTGVLFC